MAAGRSYVALVRIPGAGPLVLSSLVARMATAAIGLPLLFIARDAGGSYGVAGLTLGAYWAGVALTAPARGRLVDRRGAGRMIPPFALGTFLTLVLMPVLASVSPWLLVPLGLVGGAAMPPLFATTRGVWRRMLPPGDPLLQRAYAFESVAQDGVYLGGPLLAGGGIALAGASATLVAVAAVMLVSAVVYARLAPPGVADAGARPASPIRVRGVQVLALTVLLTSVSFGVLEVGVPAFADERGDAAVAGVLLALFAAGGVIGGLAFGARTWRASPVARFLWLGAFAVVVYALLPLASSVAGMGALLVLVGMPFTAQFVALGTLLDRLAPPGSDTEAMTWMTLGNGIGIAAGSALGGTIVDASGTDAAFVTATVVVLAAALLALLGRRFL